MIWPKKPAVHSSLVFNSIATLNMENTYNMKWDHWRLVKKSLKLNLEGERDGDFFSDFLNTNIFSLLICDNSKLNCILYFILFSRTDNSRVKVHGDNTQAAKHRDIVKSELKTM